SPRSPTSRGCRPTASARSTSPATATTARTSSTRTTRACRRPCGISTASPCDASAACRRSSSGTTAFRRLPTCSPRARERGPSRPRSTMPPLARAPGAFAPEAAAPELLAAIEPSATLDPAGRLAIYAQAYFWRIREALRADYPRTAALLGDTGFDALVRAYLARHPSTHPSLREVGRRLPEFLATGWEAPAPPFLVDLARLEWARVEVFDAPDASPLTAAALRAVPADAWPDLRLAPVPACEVVRAAWPVHALWAGADEVAPAPTVLRVWRQGWAVYHAPMDATEAA